MKVEISVPKTVSSEPEVSRMLLQSSIGIKRSRVQPVN